MTDGNNFGIDVQDRDVAILRGLFDARIATIHQLSTLYFGGRIEAARKRVQKLKAAGIIHERPRKATEPSIHCLTRKAFHILEQRGVLADYPSFGWSQLEKRARVSPMTLKHELEVMDCRAALTVAAEKSGYRIPEFTCWPRLIEFPGRDSGGQPLLVRPDGFIRIAGSDQSGGFEDLFYFELDRSTEELDRLAERAVAYRHFYLTGGLASKFGQPRSEFKQFPFVVLMVFRTAERRNNMTERLLRIVPPIRNQVWLATFEEFIREPLGKIWVKPGDYARITAKTQFDSEFRRDFSGYRRLPEREEFVERGIAKHPLLQSGLSDEH